MVGASRPGADAGWDVDGGEEATNLMGGGLEAVA
jgi:hypothetical protein